METMSKRTNEKVALGLGLIAGGLVGYWLNSDQGREVRTDVADKASDYSEKAKEQAENLSQNLNQQATQISDRLNTQAQHLSENLNRTVEQGRNYLNQATETVRSQFQSAEQGAEDMSSDFKAGVDYALKNIQKQAKALSRNNGKS
jgi:gas vesicle protein